LADFVFGERRMGIADRCDDRSPKSLLLECSSGPAKARNPSRWIEFKDDLFQIAFAVPLRRPEAPTTIGSTNLNQRIDSAHDRRASENRVAVLPHSALPSVMDE
jgi:hypothetical protein